MVCTNSYPYGYSFVKTLEVSSDKELLGFSLVKTLWVPLI